MPVAELEWGLATDLFECTSEGSLAYSANGRGDIKREATHQVSLDCSPMSRVDAREQLRDRTIPLSFIEFGVGLFHLERAR